MVFEIIGVAFIDFLYFPYTFYFLNVLYLCTFVLRKESPRVLDSEARRSDSEVRRCDSEAALE